MARHLLELGHLARLKPAHQPLDEGLPPGNNPRRGRNPRLRWQRHDFEPWSI
jgi:hypothetical protein